jgi:hypothetical protein
MAFWIGKASSALASLMHAAALDGRTMHDVYEWGTPGRFCPRAHPLRSSSAASGWLGPIQEIRRPGRTADSIRMTGPAHSPGSPIRPSRQRPRLARARFDVADFVSGRNTLYMIGTGREEAPIAPLFRAFAEYVHAGAAFTGSLQPHGRLDRRC